MDINHAPNQCPHCDELEATCDCEGWNESIEYDINPKHRPVSTIKMTAIESDALATLRADNGALKAENARYREIVSVLAEWHDEASQIDTSPMRLPVTNLLVGKRRDALDELCSDAWQALNGGGDE